MKLDVEGSAFLDLQIRRAMIELKQMKQAAALCHRAEDVFLRVGEDAAAQASLQLARIAVAHGDMLEALKRLNKILGGPAARSSGVQTSVALRLRAQVNAALGHEAAALSDLTAYVQVVDRYNTIERGKQLLVQRAGFATDRQLAENRELERDLAFAREREDGEQSQQRLVYTGGAVALILLCTITFMGFSHRRRLTALADIDGLTQLLNRRAIIARAPVLIARAREQLRWVAVVVVDLDHFKRVNDTFGHGMGGEVLKRFAAVATTTLRRDDLLSRWGGEEFVFLLFDLAEHELHTIMDRLRMRLAQDEQSTGAAVAIRFSAGMSIPEPGETFEAAVARADEALYEAKRRGRNRTVTFEPVLAVTAIAC